MTTLGTGLVIFCSLLIILICIIHYFWKNSLQKQKLLKVILTFLSIFWIAYFTVIRWVPNIQEIINNGGINNLLENLNYNQYEYSFLISKVLLLDLCPFMSLAMSVAIIFSNKQMNLARIIAPIGLFCGFITIYFGCSQDELDGNNFAQYLFIGIGKNKLYFLMHFYLLVVSLIILLNYKRFNLINYLEMLIFLSLYLLTVYGFVKRFNLTNNVTGLVYGDWYPIYYGISNAVIPEYGSIANIFPNITYPGIMYLSYFFVWLILTIIVIVKYFLTFFSLNKINLINVNMFWYKKHFLCIKNKKTY